jgi:glycosyltransferase involved in cell wall biosynthesis
VRLVAYTDYLYRERDGAVFADRAFVRFIGALAYELHGLRLLGRLDHGPGPAHYALGDAIEFVALPHYARLTQAVPFARSLPGTLKRMWRALDGTDTVFSLGPHPPALALALIALLRRRRLVLGVRQDFPAYTRHRHPGRVHLQLAALGLEGIWRALALARPVIVVGPDLAWRYRRASRVLEIAVSLITAADVQAGRRAAGRTYDGEALTVLTVGRLDAEKNPLLLADVLALLRKEDPRWRLVVCGEGDLAGALRARIEALGLTEHCELRGYVPLDGGLLDLYRESHAFLHVSRTEGLPQVLIEAYASGLPSVATAVGGVRSLGDCSLLVEPGDAAAAAAAVQRLIDDRSLCDRLIAASFRRAERATLEAQVAAVARFIGS